MEREVAIYPLVTFRILFGLLMAVAAIRFMLNGWIGSLYLQPAFHFPFFGISWIQVYSPVFMYGLFVVLILTSVFIMAGFLYRLSAALYFMAFTYLEMIDKTYYLNHYYFIILISFLLIFLPAHRFFSVDSHIFKRCTRMYTIPYTYIFILQFQLAVVYFFAGVAKVNSDWLLHALPLRMWLPPLSHLPVLGYFFAQPWFAVMLSWAGCMFDLSVAFLLWRKRTRIFAYLSLVVFHLFTGFLFPIGMFPLVMIGLTTIFFSESWHARFYRRVTPAADAEPAGYRPSPLLYRWFAALYITVQLVLPMRYLVYPGKLFWTEQGFRFSWRVMLMEKSGTAFFTVKNPDTGSVYTIINRNYLTPLQEKMMSTQPDMIVDFAHLLAEDYRSKGVRSPQVFAEVYVSLNGRASQLLINPEFDLTLFDGASGYKPFVTSGPENLW